MAAPDSDALSAIFKAYDIRGVVPDQWDADDARRIGAAVAAFHGAPKLVLGRDMRPSGVELTAAFSEGVHSQGVDVVDIGLASTDLLYFASGTLDLPGVMFTASHNPAQYNGIKLCGRAAAPIGVDTGLAEIQALASKDLPVAATRGTTSTSDMLEAFARHVHSFVDVTALTPLKVVCDTANGMGGLVVPAVFDGLPFEVDILYPELDGTFPNHPADPIQPENQRDLQARIQALGADVGLAFDGDADRCFVVDEQSVLVSGSTTTALVARSILARKPGAKIIHNLICSKAVAEVVREAGGTPVRSKVGHSYIKAVMAEQGAAFGGEHSGHYYFADNWRADSGIIAAMMILETRCTSGVALSELRKPVERYSASGEINTEVADAAAAIQRVAAAFADLPQDRLDGLTVDGGDWWCNLRPSNTEPLLRLNLEAATPAACDDRVAEVLALFS